MEDDRQNRALKILQGIMPKLMPVLGRREVMKFHADCSSLYTRIEVAMEILIHFGAGPPSPLHASEIYIENLVKYLTKIRYIPEIINQDEFLVKFRNRIDYVYELYQWLFTNSARVKIRSYLSKFVDPVNIPDEFLHDPDIRKVYMANRELIEVFWVEYKQYMGADKGVEEAKELQKDLKAMFQEAANIEKRTKAQKEKLQNVPKSETLIMFGKAYNEAVRQQSDIDKEISATKTEIRNAKRMIKDLVEKEKKYGSVNGGNFLASVEETLARKKTMLRNSLEPERIRGMQMCHVLEDTMRQGASTDQLIAKVGELKNKVQTLLNEKIALHSSTEDKLNPFRKQAAGVANKKQALSEKVSILRNQHEILSETLKSKQGSLHEVVGGEVYHGDQLKNYIAELRAKSNQYKLYRGHLQAYSTEAGTLNRTIDILRLVDPSVNEILDETWDENHTQPKASDSVHTDSVQEAKHLSKSLSQDIDGLTHTTAQIHNKLTQIKKELENLSLKRDETKERFDQVTKFVLMEVEALKQDQQMKHDRIEILEQQWKDTTQELDKLDQVFSRLVDDLLDEDAPKKDSYYHQLLEKKEAIDQAVYVLHSVVAENDKKKEVINRRIKFYNNLEILLQHLMNTQFP